MLFYVLHLKQFGGWIFSWLNTDFSQHWSLLEHKHKTADYISESQPSSSFPCASWKGSSALVSAGRSRQGNSHLGKNSQDKVMFLNPHRMFSDFMYHRYFICEQCIDFLFHVFKHTFLFVIRNQNDPLKAVFRLLLGTCSTKYGDPE